MKRTIAVLLAAVFLPVAAFGLLKKPNSLAFDQKGHLYVLSGGLICEYDAQGRYIRALNEKTARLAVDPKDNTFFFVKREGNRSTFQRMSEEAIREYAAYLRVSPEAKAMAEKQFRPDYIGPGPAGSLYALGYGYGSHHGRDTAGIIDSGDGRLVLSFGEYTREDKPYGLYEPLAVAADSVGNMYIVNRGAYGVKKYDQTGRFIGQWGKRGGGDGEFEEPTALAIDPRTDDVYVADSYSTWDRSPQMRVQKFNSDGKFMKKWGEHFGVDWRPLGWLPVFYPSFTNIAEIDGPAGLAVDGKGCVYVVEQGESRIIKFDGDGKEILSFGERGTGPGQFDMHGVSGEPVGIAVDGANNVYVCDQNNDRVQKFDENGKFLMEIK